MVGAKSDTALSSSTSPKPAEQPPATPLLRLKQSLLSKDFRTVLDILDKSDNRVLSEPDGPDGIPVLHVAVVVDEDDTGSASSITEQLIRRGADVNAVDKVGRTALHLASSAWRLGPVKSLLRAGSDIFAADREGFTPLMLAAASCQGGKMLLDDPARSGTNPVSLIIRVFLLRRSFLLHETARYLQGL